MNDFDETRKGRPESTGDEVIRLQVRYTAKNHPEVFEFLKSMTGRRRNHLVHLLMHAHVERVAAGLPMLGVGHQVTPPGTETTPPAQGRDDLRQTPRAAASEQTPTPALAPNQQPVGMETFGGASTSGLDPDANAKPRGKFSSMF